MDIIVCIKAVTLTAALEGSVRSYDSVELNPFDRPVLETAICLREENGGRVTALSMGPEAGLPSLYEALAMGVDRGVLIADPALAGSDTLATSTALSAAIRRLRPFDLILFGTRAADSDTGQVGPQTAVRLDLPLVTQVHAVEPSGNGLRVERNADQFAERFDVTFPAALTIHPGSAQPRDMDLANLGPVFEEQNVTFWGLSDIGLSPEQVGDAGSPTRVRSVSRIKRQKMCEFINGSPMEQADQLMKRLTEAGEVG